MTGATELDLPLMAELRDLANGDDPQVWTLAMDILDDYKRMRLNIAKLNKLLKEKKQ